MQSAHEGNRTEEPRLDSAWGRLIWGIGTAALPWLGPLPLLFTDRPNDGPELLTLLVLPLVTCILGVAFVSWTRPRVPAGSSNRAIDRAFRNYHALYSLAVFLLFFVQFAIGMFYTQRTTDKHLIAVGLLFYVCYLAAAFGGEFYRRRVRRMVMETI